jgi:hypothetical protein
MAKNTLKTNDFCRPGEHDYFQLTDTSLTGYTMMQQGPYSAAGKPAKIVCRKCGNVLTV